MTQVGLSLHGQEVRSVFRLLGDQENDLTYSVGWALARCPSLLRQFIYSTLPRERDLASFEIRLQHFGRDGGYTDIEIESPNAFVIVEAKAGWKIPTSNQLLRYRPRFPKHKRGCIVSLSRCDKAYAAEHLPASIRGIPVVHTSWAELQRFCSLARKAENHAGKRLLTELATYLGEIMETGGSQPHLAYCVSISDSTPRGWKISWVDIIEKKRSYFFPFNGKGWPKVPPTYVAFRYRGRLQSIHFLEKSEIVSDMHSKIREIPQGEIRDHFLFKLGKGIVPANAVKLGQVYPNARVWCYIDTLLTSKSVREALDTTKRRKASLAS